MSTPSGRFRPVDYPEEFKARVYLYYKQYPMIIELMEKRAYSLGAYLNDICAYLPTQEQLQLSKDWRAIVDSRPAST